MIGSSAKRRASAAELVPGGIRSPQERPAALAAARVSRASLVLGGLGLGSAIFILVGLLHSWRVTSHMASHHISVLGLVVSYPTANIEAIVMLVLAIVGAVVVIRTVSGAVREVQAARRFDRGFPAAHAQSMRGALLIVDPQPRAFCAGLLRPRVYVSTGAVAMLDDEALDAVLAHERHHAHRRDPLRFAVGRVLIRALFFLPELEDLVERQRALAELSADESAANAAPENRSALARAMLSFSDAPGSAHGAGIDPARVDYLLGESPSWRFPALVCVAAASVLALLAAVAVLAGQLASGSATLGVPFLSRQPCVVVLAGIPAALGLFTASYRRRLGSGSSAAASSSEVICSITR
jgi:bla regulator protein blaR1